MANATKTIKTPVGELSWIFVDGKGRNTAEDGQPEKFKRMATLHLEKDTDKCNALIALIDGAWNELKLTNAKIKKATQPKSVGYKEVKDRETDEPTGVIAFAFSTNSFWPDGKANEISIFDKKANKISLGETKIGNGSRGVLHGSAGLYEFQGSFGISLYLSGIQLTKLVPYEGSEVNADEIEDDEAGEDDGLSMIGQGVSVVEDAVEV